MDKWSIWIGRKKGWKPAENDRFSDSSYLLPYSILFKSWDGHLIISNLTKDIWHWQDPIRERFFQGNPTLFWRRGAAPRERMSLAHDKGNVIAYFSVFGTVMFELTFGRRKKQKKSGAFFQNFILEKGRLKAAIQIGWTKNFEITLFGYLTKKLAIRIFLFSALPSCTRETACGPKKTLFLGWDELGPLGLRGISPKLNVTATILENSMLRFLLEI